MIKPNAPQSAVQPLALFKERQKKIAGFFSEAMPILQKLNSTDLERARRAEQRLANESFKVLVIGEFKRGKSTLINALLGEHVLPSFSWPCTAVINEIKYGVEKKAILYFKDELPQPLPGTLTPEAREHIEKATQKPVPPLEIPIQDLEKYVAIPDTEKDQAQSVAETPYQKVEIFWPLAILQNGVELIDSPGLNEHQNRNNVVTSYIDKVDAIIWVLTCQALASMSEIQEVEKAIKIIGHQDIFFICNFFDQIKLSERDGIVQRGRKKLQEYTELKEDCIHFVSSLKALEAKTGIDDMTEQKLDSVACATRMKESGFETVEKSLYAFLSQHQGTIKLLSPIRQLTRYIDVSISEIIPAQKKMSELPLKDLQKKQDQLGQQLSQSQRDLHQMEGDLRNRLGNLKNDLHEKLRSQIALYVAQIPDWIKPYTPKTDISIFSLKEGANKLTEEITQYIQKEMDDQMLAWSRHALRTYIADKLQEIFGDMQKDFTKFLRAIDEIKASTFGIESETISKDYQIATWQRVLAGSVGLLVGGVGSGLVGMQLGWKHMFISLLPSFGIIVGATLLNIANPLFLIPALLGAAGIQGWIKSKMATAQVKEKVAVACRDQLSQNVFQIASETSEKICQEIDTQFIQAIISNLNQEIQSLQDQLQHIINERNQGESNSQTKHQELDALARQLTAIKQNMYDTTYEIASPKPIPLQ